MEGLKFERKFLEIVTELTGYRSKAIQEFEKGKRITIQDAFNLAEAVTGPDLPQIIWDTSMQLKNEKPKLKLVKGGNSHE